MDVLSLYQEVTITEPGIVGTLTAIRIGDCVDYEVTWWDGPERQAAWFSERELTAVKKTTLGFRSLT